MTLGLIRSSRPDSTFTLELPFMRVFSILRFAEPWHKKTGSSFGIERTRWMRSGFNLSTTPFLQARLYRTTKT